VGATATAVVTVIIAATKFIHGAWIVVIAIPILVYLMSKVNSHYRSIASQLSLEGAEPLPEYKQHKVIVPVSGAHRAVQNAVRYAKALSGDVVALYVCFDPAESAKVRQKWQEYDMGVPLLVLDSPFRSVVEPLVDYIEGYRKSHPDSVVTVVLPEFVPQKWWHHLLHNQTAILLKGILLFKRGVVATSVPLQLAK
jgi:hypothetical protein